MDRVADHVDKSIRDMLRCPEMWGGAEAVELQVLQLLEIRHLATAPPGTEAPRRQVTEAYRRFSSEVLGGGSADPLSRRLEKEGRKGDLYGLLETFVALQVRTRPARPALPDSPAPSPLLFGIDYDGAISRDPAFFRDLIRQILRRGHFAVAWTQHPDEAPFSESVRLGVGALQVPGLQVLFAGSASAQEAARQHGLSVHLWLGASRPAGICSEASVLAEVAGLLQQWVDKQGHDRCHYYPDIFQAICRVLGVKPRQDPGLPPRAEFEQGCRRYQREQYGDDPR